MAPRVFEALTRHTQRLLRRRAQRRVALPAQIESSGEVVDRGLDLTRRQQHLSPVLAHHSFARRAFRLTHETVVRDSSGSDFTHRREAVGAQGAAPRGHRSTQQPERALGVTGPQRFDDVTQRIAAHAAPKCLGIRDARPQVCTDHPPGASRDLFCIHLSRAPAPTGR
ncbi:hypothetical protein [Microbacterium testaceum]|uniref:hypothetical protein n=1 Tax=Microbacterium testaceum TaxID=2033 RepID=UPI0038091801